MFFQWITHVKDEKRFTICIVVRIVQSGISMSLVIDQIGVIDDIYTRGIYLVSGNVCSMIEIVLSSQLDHVAM